MTSSNLGFLEFEGEILAKMVEGGLLTYEEIEAAKNLWVGFQDELCHEYPTEVVKALVLAELRRKCEWYTQKIKEIELENKDARQRGVSFKERQKYSTQIETLKQLFKETRLKGIEYSKRNVFATDFVRPGDIEVVHSRGFEKHLKYALI